MPGGLQSTERLLERGAELSGLSALVPGAPSDPGRLVLIGGEAGIGKTSLIRALRFELGDSVPVLLGACEALSVPVPLGPWRQIAAAAAGRDLTEIGEDRFALAGELAAVLSDRAPAIVVIEDAHWSDPLSLDLVRMLGRRVEELGVLLVVSYRNDEVAANPALELMLGDLATGPAVERIELQPLSDAAVRELSAPAGLDPAELARLTGGNPFLVVESVAAGARLPASVRDAALARAGRLGPEARRAVDAAAVIGQRFDARLLEAVLPGSGEAVEEALARGVLVAEGEQLGFRHELIREALAASASPARRTQLHARVAAALAEHPRGADHARLAHHAELGGLDLEAARYARLAAEDAARVGALPEVHRQTERALRLGHDLSPEVRFELLLRYSRAANFSSLRLAEASDAAEQAIELARRLKDPVREGRALLSLVWALWSLDRVTEARAAAERAIELMEPTAGPGDLAPAYSTHIRMEATAFDPAVAIASAPAALALAQQAGSEEIGLEVEISLALAEGHRGDPAALDRLTACLERARAAGSAIQVVRTYVNSVFLAAVLRRHTFLEERAAEAFALFEDYGTRIPGYAIETFRARSLLDRGHWDEALTILTRSHRDWVSERPVVLALRGIVAARRGEGEADALLAESWAAIRDLPENSRHGTIRAARIEAAWLRGDHAAAVEGLRAAQAEPATLRFARTAAELALWGRRHGVELPAPELAPEPVRRELEGDWHGAIGAWRELDAPYESALAALPGDERAAREGLATLRRLGANGAAAAFGRAREAAGARRLRGPRRSTLSHPAGLTRREQEVLESMATGASNPAIAQRLQLSERTVAHHVSAILGKLGAANRVGAIEQARRAGLLAKDGHPAREK